MPRRDAMASGDSPGRCRGKRFAPRLYRRLPPGLETSLATPSNFAVPPDRPHFAVWPRRLPRAVIAPETSLWFNLEVTATRFPDRAAYLFFGRPLTYRQLRD